MTQMTQHVSDPNGPGISIADQERGTTILKAEGVTKTFGAVKALTDVSLAFARGEVHALLGENGAGKSTLMNVVTGVLAPNRGTISIDGDSYERLTPRLAADHGIAIVHQHPAVMPDLTVMENILIARPKDLADADNLRAAVQTLIDRVGLTVHLDERVENLSIAQKHLLEIAKALGSDPQVLILDEPTAPLDSDSVQMLYSIIEEALARDIAVIYITHRMAEVRILARTVSVLRDGKVTLSNKKVSDITDDELFTFIVGRQLEAQFPDKLEYVEGTSPNLVVAELSGPGFQNISFTANPGEIIGISGVVGNGQSSLLKALSGRTRHTHGTISIDNMEFTTRQLLKNAGYMPADRHHEGLFMKFGLRENVVASSLSKVSNGIFLNSKKERVAAHRALEQLNVKASSIEADISSLSGGNQQKVVMARTELSAPKVILADEPTQGVDVGARAEIYQILRELSASGTPVVVVSSDAAELEGLCDKVLVMSRGQIVAELSGEEVTEQKMVRAAVSAQTESIADAKSSARKSTKDSSRAGFERFLRGDYSPAVLLGLLVIGLALYVFTVNDRYFNAFNISSMMLLASALAFIAIGQTVTLLVGGIDLSLGPLAGLVVVIASFHLNEGASLGGILLGLATMLLVSIIVGLINGVLIRYVKFTAVAATLTLYIAIQGISLILRPRTGGAISKEIIDLLTAGFGAIPFIFIAAVVVTLLLEYALRKSRWGLSVRGVGSDEVAARNLGVRVDFTVVGAYVLAAVLTFLGGVVLMAQIGVGDPAQGVSYTMTSITAAVLGGASLLGGRASFIGTLLGAMLLTQVMNATVFLRLDGLWQYLLQGFLITVAAVVYTTIRGRRARAL
ncbi:MAG: ATP-binding cassette domain-containing protein [Gulosibacter sp.]|uniref:ATP-binding cassette domain-containing protein n=1 Tax=Gulosibacter sp. TaxID=2817531 RepID=UPI003F926470